MYKVLVVLFMLFLGKAYGETVDLGEITFIPAELACPEGDNCTVLDDSFCSHDNIEVSANNDNTFDMVFNNYLIMTHEDANYSSASCIFQLPINLDTGQQVSLSEVAIAGVTVVYEGNQTSAGITHFFGLRESTRKEAFSSTQAFTVAHAQELSEEFSPCGEESVVISTRLDITARKNIGDTNDPFINLSSGAGSIQYSLNYQDCEPEPTQCSEDETEINGICYSHAENCSAYTPTGLQELCLSSADEIACHWDIDANSCVDHCRDDQIVFEQQCYDFSNSCSGYDFTAPSICNSDKDALVCSWDESTSSCIDNCGVDGTFELDGQCYLEDGQCSQYDHTNPNTCNNDFDEIGCDWIPASSSDAALRNTCAPGCPEDMFVLDGVCYEDAGNCSQYDETDVETCNTGEDSFSCDWIPGSHSVLPLANTCAEECPEGTFERDGTCYEEGGNCSQYNGTDSDTCNNGDDGVNCDWEDDSETCYSESDDLCSSEDLFELGGICYDVNGNCSQYNDTDDATCNTGLDNIKCDWNANTDECSPEADDVLCDDDNVFELDGVCYELNGSCAQYNGTDSATCNTSLDNFACDWNANTEVCSPEADDISCDDDNVFELDGVCYELNGSCSQYNGTDSSTCNTGLDDIACDWSGGTGVCWPEADEVSCDDDGVFELDGRCYLHGGSCSQYNGTDEDTCNTEIDALWCDWDPATEICSKE